MLYDHSEYYPIYLSEISVNSPPISYLGGDIVTVSGVNLKYDDGTPLGPYTARYGGVEARYVEFYYQDQIVFVLGVHNDSMTTHYEDEVVVTDLKHGTKGLICVNELYDGMNDDVFVFHDIETIEYNVTKPEDFDFQGILQSKCISGSQATVDISLNLPIGVSIRCNLLIEGVTTYGTWSTYPNTSNIMCNLPCDQISVASGSVEASLSIQVWYVVYY